MTVPTKILLAAFLLLGVNVYADLTASDEGAIKFEAAKAADPEPTAPTKDEDLRPEMADGALEGRVCTTECTNPNTRSTSQLKHSNFKDLRKISELSTKQP